LNRANGTFFLNQRIPKKYFNTTHVAGFLEDFLHFFWHKLDCFIDLRLGHDKKVKIFETKDEAGSSTGLWTDRAILTWFSTVLTAQSLLKAAEWGFERAREVLLTVFKWKNYTQLSKSEKIAVKATKMFILNRCLQA
jgi:hypothetical protein